jgi:hypothetical protein
MAARKPKNVSAWLGGNRGTVQSGGGRPTGIVDDIAKGIKDIASPWLPAAPGQNRSVTQAQGLARATAETLDQTVTGGLVQAGTQGNKALAKQAAINAAALGTGYVAGKAVVTAGILPKALNKITGKTILIHGSSNKIVGKNINPSLASEYFGAPIKPAVFGWNPKGFEGKGYDREHLIDSIRAYGKRDIAIGVVKKNTLMPYETTSNLLRGMENARVKLKLDDMIISKSPVPIKKILTNPSDTELIKAIKRAGGKVPKKR